MRTLALLAAFLMGYALIPAHANSSCIPTVSVTASSGENEGMNTRESYRPPYDTYDARLDNEDQRVSVTLSIPLGGKMCDSYEAHQAAEARYDDSRATYNDVNNLERMIRLCTENPEHPLLEGKCK